MREDWLEFMLRRGEELARRLTITPTPPLSAAARHYLNTNLYARSSSGRAGPLRPAECHRQAPFRHGSPWVLGPSGQEESLEMEQFN
jgi:hypothetical protein